MPGSRAAEIGGVPRLRAVHTCLGHVPAILKIRAPVAGSGPLSTCSPHQPVVECAEQRRASSPAAERARSPPSDPARALSEAPRPEVRTPASGGSLKAPHVEAHIHVLVRRGPWKPCPPALRERRQRLAQPPQQAKLWLCTTTIHRDRRRAHRDRRRGTTDRRARPSAGRPTAGAVSATAFPIATSS